MGGSNRTCGTEGCDRPHRANGLCGTCDSRRRRNDTTRPPCSLDGCDLPIYSRNLCNRHYLQARRGTIPLPDRVQPTYASPACEVDGCDKSRKGGGLCAMHYSRLTRYGYIGDAEPRHKPNVGPCSEPDCDIPADSLGLCRNHYRLVRLQRATCAVDGCERPKENRDYCGMHYMRWQLTGEVGPPDPLVNVGASDRPCTVEGCERPGNGGGGLCPAHRQQVRVYGITPTCFTRCCLCDSHIDLRTSTGRLRPLRPDLLCDACRDAYKKRRKRKWPMTVEQLAERDGSVCSICDEPVDLALRRPDPMSPSVDHYVPRARGGTDIEANLRLAHIVCNVRKGASIPI